MPEITDIRPLRGLPADTADWFLFDVIASRNIVTSCMSARSGTLQLCLQIGSSMRAKLGLRGVIRFGGGGGLRTFQAITAVSAKRGKTRAGNYSAQVPLDHLLAAADASSAPRHIFIARADNTIWAGTVSAEKDR